MFVTVSTFFMKQRRAESDKTRLEGLRCAERDDRETGAEEGLIAAEMRVVPQKTGASSSPSSRVPPVRAGELAGGEVLGRKLEEAPLLSSN